MAVVFFCISLLTISGFLGRYLWVFSIIDFMRVQIALVSFICTAYHIWIESYVFAFLFFALTTANLFRIRKFLKPSFKFLKKTHISKADIISLNLNKNNGSIEKVVAFLSGTKPEILVLLELTGRHEKALKPILQNYSYKKRVMVRDGFMLEIFSKSEL